MLHKIYEILQNQFAVDKIHFEFCKVQRENSFPLPQEQKELLKQNKKAFFSCFKSENKQTSKNVADNSTNSSICNLILSLNTQH